MRRHRRVVERKLENDNSKEANHSMHQVQKSRNSISTRQTQREKLNLLFKSLIATEGTEPDWSQFQTMD
jgi:hypothetical protein